MEGRIRWSGRSCEGDKDIYVEQPEEDTWRQLSVILLPRAWPLITPHVEILQGSCNVEIPASSQYLAPHRSDNVRVSLCNGLGLDGQR